MKKQKIYLVITVENGDITNISPFYKKDYDKMRRKFVKQCKKLNSSVTEEELWGLVLFETGHGEYDNTYVVIEAIKL